MEQRSIYDLGNRLWRAGRLPEAEVAYRRALAISDNPDISRDLGSVLLAQGQDDEGWKLYEERPARRKAAGWPLSFPEWRGEPLGGKRLLVRPEQGFGDQILAARYVANLAAAHVTMYCLQPLVRLFSEACSDVRAIGAEAQAIGRYDFWTLPLSLPRFGLPAAIPYLGGLPSGRGGIGVAWRGNPLPDPARSMPDEAAAALLALPGAISLHPEDTGARDFQDTADIIAGLDLVISIDTSVAHLAGAMGKRLFVLLHAGGHDWRWRAMNPFYPQATCITQATPGDWAGVITRALDAVET